MGLFAGWWPTAAAPFPCWGLCASELDLFGLFSSSDNDRVIGSEVLCREAEPLWAGGAVGFMELFPSFDHAGTGGLEMLGEMAIFLAT